MAQERVRIGRLLKQLNETIERQVNNEMRTHGMTASQLRVLLELQDSPAGTLSFKDLECRMGVAQSTIWGLVSRLEGKELVESQTSPHDTRAKVVRLTPAGATMCKDCRIDMDKHEHKLRSSLTAQEAETLTALLQRVYASLTDEQVAS